MSGPARGQPGRRRQAAVAPGRGAPCSSARAARGRRAPGRGPHVRAPAPARALRPGRVRGRRPAVDAGAGRTAEPAVALREPLQALVPHGGRARGVRRPAPAGAVRRRASLAIGAASLVVNQPMKLLGNRTRPDRTGPRGARGRAGCRCRPRRRSRRALGVGRCLRGRGRRRAAGPAIAAAGRRGRRWPSRGSTPACTTRVTCSSGWRPGPCSAGWSSRAGADGSPAADRVHHDGRP